MLIPVNKRGILLATEPQNFYETIWAYLGNQEHSGICLTTKFSPDQVETFTMDTLKERGKKESSHVIIWPNLSLLTEDLWISKVKTQ